jgi:hypothetical protein
MQHLLQEQSFDEKSHSSLQIRGTQTGLSHFS